VSAVNPSHYSSLLTHQQVAQLQKQKANKAGGKKKEDTDAPAQQSSVEPAAVDKEEDLIPPEPVSLEPSDPTLDAEANEPVETAPRPSHGRQPSLSLQSKMRSTSFRRTSLSLQNVESPTAAGKSPNLPLLSPEGDTVPDIYRKQAIRIEDLEKENKRLEKEVRDGESRWRKSEEELEDLREWNGELVELKARAERAEKKAEEVEKLVSLQISLRTLLMFYRNSKSHLFRGRITNYKALSLYDLLATRPCLTLPMSLRSNFRPSPQQLKPWSWRYPISEPNSPPNLIIAQTTLPKSPP
jgi:hypothetical protein